MYICMLHAFLIKVSSHKFCVHGNDERIVNFQAKFVNSNRSLHRNHNNGIGTGPNDFFKCRCQSIDKGKTMTEHDNVRRIKVHVINQRSAERKAPLIECVRSTGTRSSWFLFVTRNGTP
ncbi:uncharacterized protein LOC143426799 [Xylocopa sonorina]|uniref:uncharacterized protein LOC143426799 n=1 Tax=Xylocopa sonorina TaxID=1818115 RepID=UPI00403B0531